MPTPTAKRRARTTAVHILHAELPPELVDWLKARAARNVRSMTAELRVILEAERAKDGPARRREAARA